MKLNDTTTKQGLLQDCEFWTGLGDGAIANNSVLKLIFINRLNRWYDKMTSIANAASRYSTFDDTNYSTQPFSFFSINEGQHDYQFLADEDGNSISDITAVLIKVGGEFKKIEKLSLDHPQAELIMSPNENKKGIPNAYIERNNSIFLTPVPNYTLADGGKLFYRRVPSYFGDNDNKEPGFPAEHHRLLSLGASYDWLIVNKSNARVLISRVEAELMKAEKEFQTFVELRNPLKKRLTIRPENTR